MNRALPIAIVALCTLILSIVCCTPSLHPLYTEDDLVQEPALLGSWRPIPEDEAEDEELERWSFSESDSMHYKLMVSWHPGDEAWYYAHMLMLDGQLFLDLTPDEESGDTVDHWLNEQTQVPAHIFFQVKQLEPTLVLAYLDPDWLDDYLHSHPKAIAHEYVGMNSEMIFTAPTEELQAFILEHIDRTDPEEDLSFRRVPDPDTDAAAESAEVVAED